MESILAAMKPGYSPEQNRAALQDALNTGQAVSIPRGAFPFAGPVSPVAQGQVLFGCGPHASLLLCQGQGPFLTDGEQFGFEVRDLNLIGNVAGQQAVTGGYAIQLDGNTTWNGQPGQTPNSRIERVRMEGMWGGVLIQDQNNLIVDGLDMRAMQGDGIVALSLNDNLRTDCIALTNVVYDTAQGAPEAGRGTGLIIDGNVQTIRIEGFNIVRALRGVEVRNSANQPLGHHAAFLYAHALMVDFPLAEAMTIAAIDQARFSQCYFHGSRTQNGIYLAPGARSVKMTDCNITGHWANGLHCEAQDIDLHGVDGNNNSQMGPNRASGFYFSAASNAVLWGGGAWQGQHAFGVARGGSAAVTILAGRFSGLSAPRLGC